MSARYDAIVVGAGPAGAAFAARAAAGGARVLVIDGRPPGFTKPCGGCFPFRPIEQALPHASAALRPRLRFVRDVVIRTQAQTHTVRTDRDDIALCGRDDLDSALLDAARAAGADVVAARATRADRVSDAWCVQAGERIYSAGALIGADGSHSALSGVRSWCTGEPDSDGPVLQACGVYAEGGFADSPLLIELGDMPGYAWSFMGETLGSIGALAVDDPAYRAAVRRAADDALSRSGLFGRVVQRYECRLRCVGPQAMQAAISGEDWALVGDAAGLVDPITGAGLLYAFASGLVAADRLLAGDLGGYPEAWWTTPEGAYLAEAGEVYAWASILSPSDNGPIHRLIKHSFGLRPSAAPEDM